MPFLHGNTPKEDPVLEPIAICGMACRLPGNVDSPSSLWELLVRKGSGNTEKVPSTRFNIDAHFHKNLERPGSFNVLGGYFLDGPAENFDPTFFNLTPVEAMWLDPQQRKMLEVCYEAIESAGLSLDAISGTNTGVWVGSFTADYQQMTFKDPDFRHSYAATGVDPGIISNRIGNVFDLNGPSCTINTACSSSVYAIHNACHSLRARDCDSALVGGVNLILTVDQHMNTAKLGVLSPTSFCHTFDECADGYGRGEGAGALYLKRMSDAVKDGDIIRAVIRSSAVNTNGKVPGYGITYPNVNGQEKVIRQAYKRAGLDPNKTAYFELHGTGTPVGDPIEARAVSNAMNDTRSTDRPLIIGAVKPNIGHSEAASGIFAVIKAALMVESGVIPGVAGLKKVNPLIPEAELNVKVNKDTSLWPEGFDSRRASVSSFGYGGTNAHVVVENVQALVPGYQHGARRSVATYDHSSTRPLLVALSAHDKTTLMRNIEANASVVDKYYLADFAHTLNQRGRHVQRAYAVATESTATDDLATSNFKIGSATKALSQLAYIFTGQGSQWAEVGKDAIKTFPVFRQTIRKLDRVLGNLEHRPSFSIEKELTAPPETSNINNANVSQPTLVATQIAIVDLLSSWGVVPTATVGHSAGEYAAAYTAGLASAPEIIIAAYYRGYCLEKFAPAGGSMLAVGKGVDDLKEYLSLLDEDIVVACENSPASVTLSGKGTAIKAAKEVFDNDKVFARELRTGMAYHSHHMDAVAKPMTEFVTQAYKKLDSFDRQWRCPRRVMVSSVTNQVLSEQEINPQYWASNLTSRVLFSTAVAVLAKAPGLENIGGFVEVGPHSALAGPFKQICQANSFSGLTYIATLLRGKDTAVSLLKTAGELMINGYPVDLDKVNQVDLPAALRASGKPASSLRPATLVDLPIYQWNYEKTFWAEPRASAEYRQLTHARHDLLGSKIPGLSHNSMVWRNILRLKDIPWLQCHKLGGSIMFPAAGHMALAIEAARQHCDIKNLGLTGVTLRKIELKNALIIPESDAGLEIQLRLTSLPTSGKDPLYSFSVESCNNDVWTIHSTGEIGALVEPNPPALAAHPIDIDVLTQRHPGKRWNDTFRRVGFEYGNSFDKLDRIKTHEKHYDAAGQILIAVESGMMVDESRYMLHPSAVDNLLQLCIISIHAGDYQEMPWGVIPIKFEEVSLRFPGASAGAVGQAIAWNPVRGERARRFKTNAQLASADGEVFLDIKGLHTVAYEAALPPQDDFPRKPLPYMGVSWKPDITISAFDKILSKETREGLAANAIPAIIDMLDHKKPITSILTADATAQIDVEKIFETIRPTTDLYVADDGSDVPEGSPIVKVTLPTELRGFPDLDLSTKDLIIFGDKESAASVQNSSFDGLEELMGAFGRAIFLFDRKDMVAAREALQRSCLLYIEAAFSDQTLVICSASSSATTSAPRPGQVDLVYHSLQAARPNALADALSRQGLDVQIKTFETELGLSSSERVILYDPSGTLLADPDEATFEVITQVVPSGQPITWLTAGVNEGKSVSGAMVAGFLRVVREEQSVAQLSLLDFDMDETFESIAKTLVGMTDPAHAADYPGDHEYWLHDGICHVSRLLPNESLNSRMMVQSGKVVEVILEAGQFLHGDPAGGQLTFTPADLLQKAPLRPDEMEIQVEHVEFHRQDMQSYPVVPRLISGKIIRMGPDVDGFKVDDTIITFVSSPYDTIVNVSASACVKCPPDSAQRLVSLLPSLCMAANSLHFSLDSLEKKHVLLLPTTASSLRSFLQLRKSQNFGLSVVATEHTAIADIIRDEHESVDVLDAADMSAICRKMTEAGASLVVVSQDFAHLSQEIWRSVPAGATFILSSHGHLGFSSSPVADPFSRGARFCSTSIASVFSSDPLSLQRSLRMAIDAAPTTSDGPRPYIINVNTLQECAETSVLTYNYGKDVVKAHEPKFQLAFSSEDTYLLVGCLGGLGRSLTSWMMSRGAKHFAFISRSGADKPEAAQLIKSINSAGAIPEVFRGDASNQSDVSRALASITSSGRRIRGVVHAAMVLQDGMLGPSMTAIKFKAALAPKVDGARALHDALRGHDLDFFVMTSSISATVGQPGQTNYAAANSFLDNLAWRRNLAGLAASSLVLPMVLGVGVVAENELLEEKITRRGMYGVDEREMLRGFEAAMSQPRPVNESGGSSSSSPPATHMDAAIVLGLDPGRLAVAWEAADNSAENTWIEDARFSHIRLLADATAGDGSKSGGGAGAALYEQVLTAASKEGYEAALGVTASYIMQKCASILMLNVDDFELDGQSIGAYGLDSMIGAELRNWLFKELQLNIAFQELLATTLTFKGLSTMVLEGFGIKSD